MKRTTIFFVSVIISVIIIQTFPAWCLEEPPETEWSGQLKDGTVINASDLKRILREHERWHQYAEKIANAFEERQFEEANRLKETADSASIKPANLAGADLRRADLKSANLGSPLPGGYFGRADLRGADLRGAKLNGADLSEASLFMADLSEANLIGVDLSNANLAGANLNNANLTLANLNKARLGSNFDEQYYFKAAKLRRTNLNEADLSEADLSMADLTEADLTGVNLIKANLRFANLGKLDLRGVRLYETDLTGANLSGANLRGAYLEDTKLSFCKLTKADLRDARLNHTDLDGADLRDADMSGSTLYGASLEDADLRHARLLFTDLGEADLQGVNLAKADLRHSNLTKADLRGTILLGADLTNAILENTRFLGSSGLPELQVSKVLSRKESERLTTYQRELMEWSSMVVSESYFRRTISWLRLVFFDLTCQYGMNPGRSLIILICLIPYFAFFYLFALLSKNQKSGFWLIWTKACDFSTESKRRIRLSNNFPRKAAKTGLLNKSKSLIFFWIRLIRLSLLFSILSAFSVVLRNISRKSWITGRKAKGYTVTATGWARTLSGIQCLMSTYLLGLWLVTTFTNPF